MASPRHSLLSLPAEIREQIYTSLLSADDNFRPVKDLDPSAWWTYDVRLFRTCKQIHREAEKVFRRVNTFVRINSPWPEAVERTKLFALTPVLCHGEAAERFAAWRMDVTVEYVGAAGQTTSSFVVDARDMMGFCRMWYYFDISSPGLNSHFGLTCVIAGMPNSPNLALPVTTQNLMFDPWKLVRQPGFFSVTGPYDKPVLANLLEAMKQPYPDPIDCLERCESAKEAGNTAFKAKAYVEALDHYVRAFEAIHIIVDGDRRSVWAETYFDVEIRRGRFQGRYGGSVYLTLRIHLVANSIMAYNELEQYAMAYHWGIRSINIMRHHYGHGADQPNMAITAGAEWGKIYHRTAVAAKALDNMAEARELIFMASKYLPDDALVQRDYSEWGCPQLD